MENILRNKLTYHRRLFIGLVTYSLVLMGCFAVFQYHREREFKAEELNLQLQALNDRLLDELRVTDFGRIREISVPAMPSGLRVSVIDLKGNVRYDNTLDSLPGSNHLSRKEIADAVKTGEGFTLRRHSESTGETYFYSARRKGDYVVRTAVPYNVTLHQLLSADYGFLWFMMGITVIMCVIGYFTTRRVGQHVARLNRFAENAERRADIRYGTFPSR